MEPIDPRNCLKQRVLSQHSAQIEDRIARGVKTCEQLINDNKDFRSDAAFELYDELRVVFFFIAIALSIAFLHGCGAPKGFSPIDPQKAVFWDRQTSDTAELLRNIADEFNANNTGLPIYIERISLLVGLSTAAASHMTFMVFGALIVWFLIVEPHGLAKLWSIGKQKLRLWPFPH